MLTRRSFFSAITGCAASPLISGEAQPDPSEVVTITPNRDRFMQGDYRRTFEKVATDDAPIEFHAHCLAIRAIMFNSETNKNSTLPFKPVSVAFATMGGHHWLEVYFRCDSAFPDATEELLVLGCQRKIRRKWREKTSAHISDCIASGRNSDSKFIVPGGIISIRHTAPSCIIPCPLARRYELPLDGCSSLSCLDAGGRHNG